MSFLTALAYAAGGYGKGRQQRFQDQQAVTAQQTQANENRQAEADRQAQLAETKSYNAADLAQRQKQLEAQNRRDGLDANGNPIPLPGYAAPGPLPIGVKGAAATPDQMVRYYSDQARIANENYAKTGDSRWDSIAQRYNSQAATFASATTAAARGDEIIKGRIPLEQAQAAYWKDKPKEFREQLKSVEARAKATLGARYAAIASTANNAANSARTRLQVAGMDINARESVALMTQMGVLNGKNEAEAFQAAMQEQRLGQQRATATWQAQTKAIAAGGQAPAGYDPAGPPTINLTMPAIPNAAPTVTTVNITLPNGQKVAVPSVRNGPPPVDHSKPPADPRWPAIEQRYRAADAAGKAAILASPILAGIPGGKEWLQKAAAPIAPLPVRPNLTVPGSTSIRG